VETGGEDVVFGGWVLSWGNRAADQNRMGGAGGRMQSAFQTSWRIGSKLNVPFSASEPRRFKAMLMLDLAAVSGSAE
jgi:hypothetical protein